MTNTPLLRMLAVIAAAGSVAVLATVPPAAARSGATAVPRSLTHATATSDAAAATPAPLSLDLTATTSDAAAYPGDDFLDAGQRRVHRVVAVGVDPGRRSTWLAAEVRPHVDTLSLVAPSMLPVRQSAVITASLRQGGRTVPVGYPLTADWSASPNVHIGRYDGLRPWHTALFDPATGQLTARRPSTITLAVTVNGVSQRATIQLVHQHHSPAAMTAVTSRLSSSTTRSAA